MRFILKIAGCLLGSYLLGSINPAMLIAYFRGFDIRERGTGNAGATNAMFTLGFYAGLAVMLFDVFKAFFAIRLAEVVLPGAYAVHIAAGLFCMLGHMFPLFLGFHGGKGVACMAGIILKMSPKLLILLIVLVFIIGMITDCGCILPQVASILYPPMLWITTGYNNVVWMLLGMSALILWGHRKDMAKFLNGEMSGFRKVVSGKLNDCVERKS